jgi:hypothetical protein
VRIRTDDEVYRVDAVWLGPPKATFPWRARYVSWGIGLAVFFLTLTVERRIGIGFGFFSVAWALVITVVITRLVGSRISHERPLGAVVTMWLRELTAPRQSTAGTGGAVTATRIKVSGQRPQAKPGRRQLPPAENSPGRHTQQPRRQAASRTREVRGVRTPARP